MAETPPAAPPVRPDHVPEKFWDAEKGVVRTDDLIKSYGELETKLSAPPTPPPDPTKMQIPDQQTAPANASLDDILNRAGLDAQELATQFQQAGQLNDQQYTALAAQGFGRVMVDSFMQGQYANAQLLQDRQTQARTNAQTMAGGDQQLNNLLAWAASLPANRQADINERLADPNRYEGAITELMALHRDAVGAGNAQALIQGGPAAAGGPGAPTTKEEMQKILTAAKSGDETAKRRLLEATQSGAMHHLLG